MSVRERRQKAFGLFVAALVVALIAGAAGYATGYGVNSEKRIKAINENKIITAENEKLTGISADAKELEALRAENTELKATLETLTKEKEELSAKLTETEEALEKASDVAEVIGDALREESVNNSGSVEKEDNSDKYKAQITKWFALGIIGVLVLTGIAMILIPAKSRRKEDYEDDEYEDDEEEYEETEEFEENEDSEDTELEHLGDETEEAEESYEEDASNSEDMESTIVIPVVRAERKVIDEYPKADEEGEQTEMDFEEEKEDAGDAACVPDSLEELMLQSIKREEE